MIGVGHGAQAHAAHGERGQAEVGNVESGLGVAREVVAREGDWCAGAEVAGVVLLFVIDGEAVGKAQRGRPERYQVEAKGALLERTDPTCALNALLRTGGGAWAVISGPCGLDICVPGLMQRCAANDVGDLVEVVRVRLGLADAEAGNEELLLWEKRRGRLCPRRPPSTQNRCGE